MNKSKKGRKKVIPSYFQKSGDSLSSILQAGSYKRKLKQVLQKNKEFAKENQILKVDLAHSTKSLQKCTSYNAHILLAKKKLDALVGIAQTFVTGLKEIANFLDMKEFLFMTSTDEDWRKLKLPPQALDPIDEINSSVTEEVDLSSVSRETTPVFEPQRTPVTQTSKTPVTRNSKSPVTRTTKSPVTGTSKTPIINLPETPKAADTSSTSSLGTPVLCLSPLPVKRPLASIGGVHEARPPKRSKTPEKAVKNPSPKTCKSLLDQKPKPFKKLPGKTPPSPLKKSPKLSKIPTRQKNENAALPEPSIAFLPLSPPASRKTFVVRKDDNSGDNVISSRLRRETFKVPQIPISDAIENQANVPSPSRETGCSDGPITSVHSLMPNTNQSDDMEITAMLPLGQPLAFNPCPLPTSDEMELTAVLPVQCFVSAQNSGVPSPLVEPPRVSPEKTSVLTSKEVAVATGSVQTENPLARKKSLRVKKGMGVRHTVSEADENCQPSTKRMSYEDASLNAHRKSVQFSFNECYNAFQNIKTKADPPRSILKQPTQDPEPSKCKTPEPQRDDKSEKPKAPLDRIIFSSSDDSPLTPKLPVELFTEKCPQVKRNFSGVSERRSKKKTISGGDVFNEIQAFEETGPGCLVPGGRKSLHKSSESSKKNKDSTELKNATSSKDAINETEAESEPDSFVVSPPKSGKKSPIKTSSVKRKKVECAELEEPTSSKAVLNEVEVSKETDSNCLVPPAPKCMKKPVLKTAVSSKNKKESAQTEQPACSKGVLSEIEDSVETDKDCLPSVSKGRTKSQAKTSTSNKKKKSTELKDATPSAVTHNIDTKVPPAEPKRARVKKSKSKTQEDLEKVEVDIISDPERSASFGRVRRHTAAKSYKEPSLNCKMRRE